MRTRATAIVAALAIAISTFGVASASGRSDMLVGGYKYKAFNEAPRQVSISAHSAGSAYGSWAFQNARGSIACLVVDGDEAWAAGPGTGDGPGAFFYVIDGGTDGANDVVVTWGQDPWQPFEELLDWCQSKNTDFPLFAVEQGNATVVDAP